MMAGFPFGSRAAALGAGRAEDRFVADGQGLGGGEHEGRDFRSSDHGSLVQAVASAVMASV
jgi:hypothetical protein